MSTTSSPHSAPTAGETERDAGQGHHKLRRLRVYGGFLDQLDLRFTDGLNCIIGGRGSGKTTLLELVRFALDKIPRSETPGDKAQRERLQALLLANLGPTGCVELDLESREGVTYHVRRTAGDPPIVTDAAGGKLDAAVLRSSVLIDAALFSHNQIEDISGSPQAQRELIDRLCSHSLQEIATDVQEAAARLKENAQQVIQLSARIESAGQSLVNLSSWERKLEAANAVLEQAGVPPGLQQASNHRALRQQERSCVDHTRQVVSELREQLAATLPQQIRQLAGRIPQEIQEGPNGELLNGLARTLVRRETELEILLSPVLERLAQLEQEVSQVDAALVTAHRPQEEEYATLMAAAETHSERIKARDAAAREVVRLSSAKQDLANFERDLEAAQRERVHLRETFHAARKRRHDARASAAETVSTRLGGRVRVKVKPDAALAPYREFLVSIMRRSGRQYRAPIDKLIQHVSPSRLGELCDRDDHDAVSATSEVTADFAEALLKQLRGEPERRYALDVIDLEDVPRIELKIGDSWRPSHQLSTGQKSSAILPILLLESEAPLLVDQPEDNLDNSFISDAIVPQVREIKGRRQLLFITHNPNLPVLGDAENVCVLEADGRSARLVAAADVHGAKSHILRLMEGGLEAFRRRQAEYEGA
ncbi:MAG: AAA family ATPase [Myxococcales bacterium]|nr:AAA family ATPase [Myxococcales bacterium]MCB9756088.1 AAA family ATPase [Myxococcales bacterium]